MGIFCYNIIKFSLFNMSTTIGENIKYCMYKYYITMSDWYNSFSYIDKKIDVYANRKVDMNVNYTALSIPVNSPDIVGSLPIWRLVS